MKQSDSFEAFTQKVRIDIIDFLIQLGYENFDVKPYNREEGNHAIMQKGSDFVVLNEIDKKDGLDVLLDEKLEAFKKDFAEMKKFGQYLDYQTLDFSVKDYEHLGKLLMFKNAQDLRDL
ncbi:hypothetical protein KKG31_02825 [Patescibacteria group bacterium]|nr:hypothetical protein [Patescibacteria group bacterium]MBU1758095.1 hypothetical protein [Patescibacteria group bacterium]